VTWVAVRSHHLSHVKSTSNQITAELCRVSFHVGSSGRDVGYTYVGFEGSAAVTMKNAVFRDVAPCAFNTNQRVAYIFKVEEITGVGQVLDGC
jgi:hypothetical protein